MDSVDRNSSVSVAFPVADQVERTARSVAIHGGNWRAGKGQAPDIRAQYCNSGLQPALVRQLNGHFLAAAAAIQTETRNRASIVSHATPAHEPL
jgi:hypothetical protein